MKPHDYHDALLLLSLACSRAKFAFRETKDPVYLQGWNKVNHVVEWFSETYGICTTSSTSTKVLR